MSKIVKGVKKAVKKVGKFVKKHWKTIALVGLTVFTGGLATIGMAGFKAALASGAGFWSTVGSTMWAGATSIAGTFGIGAGASGSAAAAAGMKGATLLTGAGAQAIGLASAGAGAAGTAAANVGTYVGPGSSFLGGGGSVFGGGAGAPPTAMSPAAATGSSSLGGPVVTNSGVNLTPGLGSAPAMSPVAQSAATNALGNAAGQAAQGGLLGRMATAAAPAAVYGIGQALAARGAEKAARPKSAGWGVGTDVSEVYRQDFSSPDAGYYRHEGGLLAQAPQQQGFDPRQYYVDENGNLQPNAPGHMAYMGYA